MSKKKPNVDIHIANAQRFIRDFNREWEHAEFVARYKAIREKLKSNPGREASDVLSKSDLEFLSSFRDHIVLRIYRTYAKRLIENLRAR